MIWKERDQHEAQPQGDKAGGTGMLADADGGEQAAENAGDRRLANRAQCERGQRDAKLGAGQVGIQPFQQSLNGAGRDIAFIHQFGDARLPDANQGKLSGDKKAVEGDQQEGQRQHEVRL